MSSDVAFDDFGHEPLDGTPHSGNLVQYVGALFFRVQRPFNGFNLASDTAYSP